MIGSFVFDVTMSMQVGIATQSHIIEEHVYLLFSYVTASLELRVSMAISFLPTDAVQWRIKSKLE